METVRMELVNLVDLVDLVDLTYCGEVHAQRRRNRLSPIRTAVMRLPALELILWSSY
jgi:hypothetical protein